jgi:GDP-4-dehydro-6-deoxy-D-mannose reductase
MDKVVILGCNGYSGKYFQKYIRARGLDQQYHFLGIDRIHENDSFIRIAIFDLLDTSLLEKILIEECPDYIVNLAGSFTGNDPIYLEKINASLSRNIFEILLKNRINPKKILLIGSAAEYGPCGQLPIFEDQPLAPTNYYGLSKMIQTQYASYYFKNHHLNITLARTFNIIGPEMPTSLAIGSFVRQIKATVDGGSILIGALNTRRDFLYIEDVADAYWKLMLQGKPGRVYNVCSGRSYAIKTILETLIIASGKKMSLVVDPKKIKSDDVVDSFGSNYLIEKEIGWKPTVDIFNELTNIIKC